MPEQVYCGTTWHMGVGRWYDAVGMLANGVRPGAGRSERSERAPGSKIIVFEKHVRTVLVIFIGDDGYQTLRLQI